MRRLQAIQSHWTTEDRATFGKWVKIGCIGYGSLCLLLLAGIGSYVAHDGRTSTAVASASVATQSAIQVRDGRTVGQP
jgi:hypothetical protein